MTRITTWYAGTSDAFKAAWVTAVIAFFTRIAVPILTLVDNTQRWLEGTGPAVGVTDFISVGRAIAAAGFAVVAGLINYAFRRYRPNVTYEKG